MDGIIAESLWVQTVCNNTLRGLQREERKAGAGLPHSKFK